MTPSAAALARAREWIASRPEWLSDVCLASLLDAHATAHLRALADDAAVVERVAAALHQRCIAHDNPEHLDPRHWVAITDAHRAHHRDEARAALRAAGEEAQP